MYDGIDEVAGFYRGLAEAGMTVSSPIEERIAVADWGLATWKPSPANFTMRCSGG